MKLAQKVLGLSAVAGLPFALVGASHVDVSTESPEFTEESHEAHDAQPSEVEQAIEQSPGAEFIDPLSVSYTYSYTYGGTGQQALNLLEECFNCYFPVDGAPSAYPSEGQILPLENHFGQSMEVEMGTTLYPSDTNNAFFRFTTTENHVYGTGYDVNFTFYDGGTMEVTGNSPDSLIGEAGDIFAQGTWEDFADNLSAAL